MIRVKVPATSANMGPGFDSIGIALNLYNEFLFEKTENRLEFFGIPEEFCNENNIIYKAVKYCFDRANEPICNLRITEKNQFVPISRGLGSSSTCIIAGLIGANRMLNNRFSIDDLLEMAVNIEGHPDNVAPALLGGMVVSASSNNKTFYDKVNVKEGLKFVSIIPNFRLETEKARKVLPKEIPLKSGVFNESRAALLVAAMANGKFDLLKTACDDSFHQKFRASLIKGFDEVYNKAYDLNAYACYLSGAGPTIMAIISEDNKDFTKNMIEFLNKMNFKWTVKELMIDLNGAQVEGDF
ncbi:homoserine kinase [Clostridium sp. BJN0001]|uniref:homoserine kinase n=1 Tax=Clostridium sp. BJN0001 TaxID=2930219 RepID=UPI001FD30E78|nr:homoserine kinase [Clostridium sp. BJN0001]